MTTSLVKSWAYVAVGVLLMVAAYFGKDIYVSLSRAFQAKSITWDSGIRIVLRSGHFFPPPGPSTTIVQVSNGNLPLSMLTIRRHGQSGDYGSSLADQLCKRDSACSRFVLQTPHGKPINCVGGAGETKVQCWVDGASILTEYEGPKAGWPEYQYLAEQVLGQVTSLLGGQSK